MCLLSGGRVATREKRGNGKMEKNVAQVSLASLRVD